MNTLIILAVLVIVTGFVVVVLKNAVQRTAPTDASRLPYRAVDRLLSPTELAFYRVLRESVAPGQLISCKVRLTDVLTCDREAAKQGFRGKIAQKHVDFVLFDAEDARIIAAIELDDASHRSASRQQRDYFLNEACRAANVALHRFPAKASYDAVGLKEELRTLID